LFWTLPVWHLRVLPVVVEEVMVAEEAVVAGVVEEVVVEK